MDIFIPRFGAKNVTFLRWLVDDETFVKSGQHVCEVQATFFGDPIECVVEIPVFVTGLISQLARPCDALEFDKPIAEIQEIRQ